MFFCEICKIFKKTYFEDHLRTTVPNHYYKKLRNCLFFCDCWNYLDQSSVKKTVNGCYSWPSPNNNSEMHTSLHYHHFFLPLKSLQYHSIGRLMEMRTHENMVEYLLEWPLHQMENRKRHFFERLFYQLPPASYNG